MPSQVSERGQITIDRSVRDRLAIRPGMVAYQRVVGGHLEVIFLPPPHRRSLYGSLRQAGLPSVVLTPHQLEAAVVEAISEQHVRNERDNG